jgi:hypothetical protein
MYLQTSTIQPGIGTQLVQRKELVDRDYAQRCGGLGLFETGFDVSGWGWPEILIVVLGGYVLISTVFTTSRAVSHVKAIPGKRRSAKAARLRAEAKELTRKKRGLF